MAQQWISQVHTEAMWQANLVSSAIKNSMHINSEYAAYHHEYSSSEDEFDQMDDDTFITDSGQRVLFMDGVVNAPDRHFSKFSEVGAYC